MNCELKRLGQSMVVATLWGMIGCSSITTPEQQATDGPFSQDLSEIVSIPEDIDPVLLESGDYLVEGDMILSAEQLAHVRQTKLSNLAKTNVSYFFRNAFSWRIGNQSTTTIPYYLASSFNAYDLNVLNRALRTTSNGNGVNWVQVPTYTTNSSIVRISRDPLLGGGGRATVGKVSNPTFELGTSTLVYETVYHELLHVLGFMHEHQRAARISNVTFPSTVPPNSGLTQAEWEYNIRLESEQNSTLSAEYDFASIMHYPYATPLISLSGGLYSAPWANPVWQALAADYIGSYPIESRLDQLGVTQMYGASDDRRDDYYVKHTLSNRLLCRSLGNGQPTTGLTKTTNCLWNYTNAFVDFAQVSGTTKSFRSFGGNLCAPSGSTCLYSTGTSVSTGTLVTSTTGRTEFWFQPDNSGKTTLMRRSGMLCIQLVPNSAGVWQLGLEYENIGNDQVCEWQLEPKP